MTITAGQALMSLTINSGVSDKFYTVYMENKSGGTASKPSAITS
jgi:hypothetical protein